MQTTLEWKAQSNQLEKNIACKEELYRKTICWGHDAEADVLCIERKILGR